LMYRAFRAALEGVDRRYFDVARTLGATPARAFFRVVVPLAWRGILAGILLAYCRALGEFGATVLVAGNIPGRTQTIALAIYSRVQSGNEDAARPLLLIAVILAFAAVAISELVTRIEERRAS
ncbi:MAG TPA: ABC transporter permease subunit, partial [Thermoanaerobaculia bacterium]